MRTEPPVTVGDIIQVRYKIASDTAGLVSYY